MKSALIPAGRPSACVSSANNYANEPAGAAIVKGEKAGWRLSLIFVLAESGRTGAAREGYVSARPTEANETSKTSSTSSPVTRSLIHPLEMATSRINHNRKA
jgi:hypothetical protein